ncbi:hypothetical protein BRC91_05025 [Halobacteriales archaeon QS_4_62_28]|nr:MAG: hypothetical protein BRC91_05025 [Halobacteriales archaeon QS_4_62_28]
MTDGEGESEEKQEDSESSDTTEIPDSALTIAAFNSTENSGLFSALKAMESLNNSEMFSALNQMNSLENSGVSSALRAMDSLDNSSVLSAMNGMDALRNPAMYSAIGSLNGLDSSISSTLRVMSEYDSLQSPMMGQLDSGLLSTINAIGNLDSAVYRVGHLDSTLFSAMRAMENLETTLPTLIAASQFDSSLFSGLDAIDDLDHTLQTGSLISPEVSGTVGTRSQSPVLSTTDVQEPFEDSTYIASEIEDYLYEIRTQLAFRRTYQALEVFGNKIDRSNLLFISFQLLNSLPAFIGGTEGKAATVVGSVLGIIVFERTRE